MAFANVCLPVAPSAKNRAPSAFVRSLLFVNNSPMVPIFLLKSCSRSIGATPEISRTRLGRHALV